MYNDFMLVRCLLYGFDFIDVDNWEYISEGY